MKEGVYYNLNIRCTGSRTPWSRSGMDWFPNVAGDVNEDFDTLEEVKAYLVKRYGCIPKNKGKNGEHGILHKHWVEEKPDIYTRAVSPMRFYKYERIIVEKIIHHREEVFVK